MGLPHVFLLLALWLVKKLSSALYIAVGKTVGVRRFFGVKQYRGIELVAECPNKIKAWA